jgi:hypothetical protein
MRRLVQTESGEFSVTCTSLRRFANFCALAAVLFSFSHRTFAQTAAPETPDRVYRSDIDDLLTIQKVSVLPFTDNLEGIYARPLEAYFISLVEKMHRWDYVPANPSGPILSPEELEASPEKAQQVVQGVGVDGFFACRITKGPSGVQIHLSLFLSKDGKLLEQAILKEYKQFDLNSLKEQTERLLSEIVQRLPYSGRVLSREGNRVTVNLGLKDGVQSGQMLSVIQIIQAHRHPKFNFLIKTEKEIFGKIKVMKVDETLSFGVVITEKERGAIQKNAKIGPLDFVTYNTPDGLSLTPTPEEELSQRDDGKVAFGKNAHAWSPTQPPSFGQVGGLIGLSNYSGNTDVSGVGGLNAHNAAAPSIVVDGELWITPEWTFNARFKQGILSINNPRTGSQPSSLSQALSYYEAGFGYMIRLGPHVWSPNIEPFLGYFSYRLYVDDTTPRALTTTQYQGFKFGVRGSTPLGDTQTYGGGGTFSMAVNPSMHESPVTSGDSSKNAVIQFGIFGYKKLSERLKLQVDLDFEMYSSSLSGNGTRMNGSTHEPASSISQRFTTLSGGVYYMF